METQNIENQITTELRKILILTQEYKKIVEFVIGLWVSRKLHYHP